MSQCHPSISTMITLILLAALAQLSNAVFLPSYYSTCKRNDPQVSKCVLEKAEQVLPYFSKGIPELGVKPLDPLDTGDIDVGKSGQGSLGIKLFKTKVYGMGKILITSMKVDPQKQKVALKFTSDILVKGSYMMNGRILVLPVTGKGDMSIRSSKSNCTYKYIYESFFKDEIEHIKITKDDLKCIPGKTSFVMKNLFNGDKTLGDTMNRFLNDNWEEVMKELSPPVIEAIQQATKDVVNDFYAAVPYEDILPTK